VICVGTDLDIVAVLERARDARIGHLRVIDPCGTRRVWGRLIEHVPALH
jgi:hypothetical protein